MRLNFNNTELQKEMFKGEFGIEKECLRVDNEGFLSHTKHPFEELKNIDRDFCENQTEFITDVFDSANAACEHLKELHCLALNRLEHLATGNEYFWCFSNPPYVKNQDDIPVASYTGKHKGKELYRKYLAEKYGKVKMLFSGVHFNFSFPHEFIEKAYAQHSGMNLSDFKNSLYLKLAAELARYSWLVVYLTAASPVINGSFADFSMREKDIVTKYASCRCSEIGYWNDFTPILDYSSLAAYTESVSVYVRQGRLKSASELYYPVRLKPRGKNTLENLISSGINHLEFRLLDLNPLSEIGVIQQDIEFIHLLILYLSSIESTPFGNCEQSQAIANIKNAALLDDSKIFIIRDSTQIPVRDAAKKVLDDMSRFYSDYPNAYAQNILNYQYSKLTDSTSRYADIIAKKYADDYISKGMELAKRYSQRLRGVEADVPAVCG